jgi:2,4-dienoyl-CoA reductase-like NADH-dependent reductase (Old Yellow Enzyme family)
LTVSEIHEVQQSFVKGAERALLAGFNWLEVHAAHGYLLNSFMSPLSNKRTDQYGGSFENRIRMLVETVQSVKAVWPERLPLTVRISGTEWVEGGWDVAQSVELARVLKREGVDLIDCSSGGNIPSAPMPRTPGYQVHIADAVRNQAGVATAAVGLISEPKMADEIIRSGKADVVLLAREFMRNPNGRSMPRRSWANRCRCPHST